MSLVTAVIIPVKLFIYIATQISSLLRTVILYIFLRKNMVQYLLLYFTVLWYLKNWTVILRYDYKAGILLSTNVCMQSHSYIHWLGWSGFNLITFTEYLIISQANT